MTITSSCRLRPLAVLALSAGLAAYAGPASAATCPRPGVIGSAVHGPARAWAARWPLYLAYLPSAGRLAFAPDDWCDRGRARDPAVSLVRYSAHQTAFGERAGRPRSPAVRAARTGEHPAAPATGPAGSLGSNLWLNHSRRLALSTLKDLLPAGSVAAAADAGPQPKPAGSRLPWLLAAPAGLLLATRGVARFRHLRWARRAVAHIR